MRNWSIRLLATFCLLLPMTIWASAQGLAVIEGQVLNGTSDGAPTEGAPVTLWMLDGQERKILLQQTADGEGRFRFQALDTEECSYQLQVEYQGVSYWSHLVAFSQGEELLSVPVTVYESTTSNADLSVKRAHLILDYQAGTILVQEVQIFFNGGNRTYVGSDGESGKTIRFPLPHGATELRLMGGVMVSNAVLTEGGFAYSRPVPPGVKEFFFSYELPYQSTSYTLSKEIAYPTGHLDVLIADDGAEVTASGLIAQEPGFLQGRKYLRLVGQDLTPGDGLTLRLASLPLASRPSEPSMTDSTVLVKVVIGVGTLATLLVLCYPFLKKRQGEES